MLSLIQNKCFLKGKNFLNLKTPSRNLSPISGPPRFRMTIAQKIIFGGGTILLMMAIPIAGLLSLPSWSIKHQNLGKARKEPPAE